MAVTALGNHSHRGHTFNMAVIGCGATAEPFHVREITTAFTALSYKQEYSSIIDDIGRKCVAASHTRHGSIKEDLLSNCIHVLCVNPLTVSSQGANKVVDAAVGARALRYALGFYSECAQLSSTKTINMPSFVPTYDINSGLVLTAERLARHGYLTQRVEA